MGGNLKVWVLKFRGKIFGGNIMVYISSGETNTVYQPAVLFSHHWPMERAQIGSAGKLKSCAFLHIFGTKEPSLLAKHGRRVLLLTLGIAISSYRPLRK